VSGHAGRPEAGYAVTFPEAGVDEESVARLASLVLAAAGYDAVGGIVTGSAAP